LPKQYGCSNQHIWKYWNSFTTDCLIEYGADVNLKFNEAAYPTLIQALRWSASAYTVQRLIEAGANYKGYEISCEGVRYTTLLVAAFYSHVDILKIVVEKFPDAINDTLSSLNTMLDDISGVQYSCRFGDSKILLKGTNTEKLHYERAEILAAKVHLLFAISEKQNSYMFSHKDKQDIFLYIQHQLEAAKSFDHCLKVFDQHIKASYLHDNNAMGYSSEKVKFIEMIQLRVIEIFLADKTKKENQINNRYCQEAQGLLNHAIFSSKHTQNGMSNRYISQFSDCLQHYSQEIQALIVRRRRFEESLHYLPNRNHIFQAVSVATAINTSSLDCDENGQTMSIKKQ
jgi:hypothetical protein